MDWKRFNKLIFLGLLIPLFGLILGLTLLTPSFPTKQGLCRDLEARIPYATCITLKNRLEIFSDAFPVEVTKSDDVKAGIGQYLDYENPTNYGHIEFYKMHLNLLSFIFDSPVIYHFSYDSEGKLFHITYQD